MKNSTWAPLPLALALAVVMLEGVVMLLLAAFELSSLNSDRLSLGLTTTIFFAGYGAGLILCARGLWQGSAWGRSPVVLAQLIQLGVAWSSLRSSPVLSSVLAVVAVVVLVGIFHPASLRAVEEKTERA